MDEDESGRSDVALGERAERSHCRQLQLQLQLQPGARSKIPKHATRRLVKMLLGVSDAGRSVNW